MRPKKVILIVDATADTLSERAFLLETRGYRVLQAGSAESGLKALRETAPGAIDLVIVDYLLPIVDSDRFCLWVMKLHPEAKTLMVSKTVDRFVRCTANGMLTKGSSSSAELLERVQILTARKRGPKKPVASGGVEGLEALSA